MFHLQSPSHKVFSFYSINCIQVLVLLLLLLLVLPSMVRSKEGQCNRDEVSSIGLVGWLVGSWSVGWLVRG